MIDIASPSITMQGQDGWWTVESGLVAAVNEIIQVIYYWWRYSVAPWQGGGIPVMPLIATGISALVLSYFGVAEMRRWAERRLILDIPNERSSHFVPKPLGGGLAVVSVTLVGLILHHLFYLSSASLIVFIYVLGAVLIAGVGWWDDLHSLSSLSRFSVHSLSAVFAIWVLGCPANVDLPAWGSVEIGWLGIPLTFLWIVGLTNAYNFMDGIDGMAGSQAVVAGMGWLILGWLGDLPLVVVLGLLLAATNLGFLAHNWHPARIFMGDVGSGFLGFTFGFLAVIAANSDPKFMVLGATLVWPFIFDTVFTILRRLRYHENIFVAHRSHLYQRLVIAGYSHRFVTLIYAGLAMIGLALSVAWLQEVPGSGTALMITIPLLCLGLWVFVAFFVERTRFSPGGKDPAL
ncbi:MAG: MraY family glycosyltransferase [Anaerolineae bacterium]